MLLLLPGVVGIIRLLAQQLGPAAVLANLQHAGPGQIPHGLVALPLETADAIVRLVEVELEIVAVRFEPALGVEELSILVLQRVISGQQVGQLQLEVHDLPRGRNVLLDELAIGRVGVKVRMRRVIFGFGFALVSVGEACGRRHGRSAVIFRGQLLLLLELTWR